MNKTLSSYFQHELDHLRHNGKAFAAAHPKLASHLKINDPRHTDPFVQQLLEGVSFLTAKLQQQIDQQSEQVCNELIQAIYPHYAQPMPASSIVQLLPSKQLSQAHLIKKGSELQTESNTDHPCRFQTCFNTLLYPLEIVSLTLNHAQAEQQGTESVMTMRLSTSKKDITWHQLSIDSLRFYIDLELDDASLLYQALQQNLAMITVNQQPTTMKITAVGFSEQESLLPYPEQSFQGYRLVSEFFTLPEKFLFFDLQGLHQLPSDLGDGQEILLAFHLKQTLHGISKKIDQQTLKLGCTPIVNLFEMSAEPIHFDGQRAEYQVIADGYQALEQIEIYRVLKLTSHRDDTRCEPYFLRHQVDTAKAVLWREKRKPTELLGLQNTPGSECFLEFTTPNGPLIELGITPEVLCTNRDLASQLSFHPETSQLYFTEGRHEHIVAIKPLRAFTTPRYQNTQHSRTDLLAHLCANPLGFNQDDDRQVLAAIQQVLSLYSFDHYPDQHLIKKGVTQARCHQITRRHPDPLTYRFISGSHISLTIDTQVLPSHFGFLMGNILTHFFKQASAINSFTQLQLISKHKGEIYTWPLQIGMQALV